MGSNSKVKVAANRQKIVEGTNEGKTQAQIAEELNVTRCTVNRNLAKLKESFVQGNREDFEKYVRAQLDLLTKAIEEVWEGNLPPEAANSIRGMMDSIARLTGSNSPTKSIVARVDAEGSPLFLKFKKSVVGLSDAQLEEAFDQLAKLPREVSKTTVDASWFPTERKEIEQ